MKKIISVILSVLLVLSFSPLLATAYETEVSLSYPTVMVAGYASSALFLNTPGGQQQIWGLDFPNMLTAGLSYLADIGAALGSAVFNRPEKLVELSRIFERDWLEKLKTNPDGSSMYDVVSYTHDPEKAKYSYIIDRYDGEYNTEPEIAERIAQCYGENGYDMLYCFHTDFRMGTVSCAADLDEFIGNILDYTGAEKVNIYAVSHGGETTATYLSLYGDKRQVNNVVMTVPAIGGAALAADILAREVRFDEEELMRFIENGMMFETDIQWLMKAQRLGFLDTLCNALIDGMLSDVLGCWGSIWDFIPSDRYEELKEKYLDPVASAELIAQSDYYHYEILPHYADAFESCIENGEHIYIVAGCDNASVTGMQANSDAVIPVSSSTGALCADWGTRFADGYECAYTGCDDVAHGHLSPAMNIDASTGYLPEQTWYISGLFHGMTIKDDYSMDLCLKLLFSDGLLSVSSDIAYPQFHYSTNVCYSVWAAFDSSAEGFIGADDKTLTVKNLSKKYPLRIMDVSVYGADISFRQPLVGVILPGGSISLKTAGDIPKGSLTTCDIIITYKLIGSVTPYGTRTETFTLMNGDGCGDGSGSAPAFNETPFDSDIPGAVRDRLAECGLTDLLKMFYNFIVSVFSRFTSVAVC